MSYNTGGGGGGSNPPWQRNSLGNSGTQGIPSLTSLPTPAMVGFNSNQSLYSQQNMGGMGQQQQQQSSMNMMSGMGGSNHNQMANNQIYSTQSVQYPTRGLNPIAFPAAAQSGATNNIANSGGGGSSGGQQNNYNKIGYVTKLQHDFGFVDEEIFFQKNVCKDAFPKLGDRVLVEATYTSNSAFKWTATRLQVVGANYQSGGGGGSGAGGNINMNRPPALAAVTSNMQQNSHRSSGSGYNAVPPPNEYAHLNRQRAMRNLSPKRRSSDRGSGHRNNNSSHHEGRGGGNSHGGHGSYRDHDDDDRRRRRDDRDTKDRNFERPSRADKRDHSLEKREKSPSRRSSPKRKKQRVTPRYMVQIPKVSLTISDADVLELTRRYSNLYIPSDFFFTNIRWSESFLPNSPYSIQKPCSFHIMHKCVEPVEELDACLDPPDADYLYSAKVMLMGIPSMADVYSKCFAMAEDKEDDHRDFVHPTRLINFLVGVRGKNEAMAIGGPWSPSLDGANPQSDPSVLIKTAIRTCRALTGIDLSNCTQWYRFVELYYHRSDAKYKGTLVPARVETVVIYLPDVRSCMPTRLEWDTLHSSYRQKLEQIIQQNTSTVSTAGDEDDDDEAGDAASVASESAATASSPLTKSKSSVDPVDGDSETPVGAAAAAAATTTAPGDAAADAKSLATSPVKGGCSAGGGGIGGDDSIAVGGDSSTNDPDHDADETIKDDDNVEPTHFSKLDPKTMKVTDMRVELRARKLSTKGLKPQLIARLLKTIKTEAAEDAEEQEDELEQQTDEIMDQDDHDQGGDEPSEQLDMMEVVVIDEYDSSKKDSKVEEVKIMDEKERQQLERRYQLPETPQIIVHPSRVARSGKFDCTVMSLSLLLDYRPEDTKEHSFEVSLFAELFNEMLMRDFGLNIYKAIYAMPEKPKDDNKKVDDKKKVDDEKSNKDAPDEVTASMEKTGDKEEKRSKDDHDRSKDRDRPRDVGDSKKRQRLDESEDDNFSTKSGDRRRKGESSSVVKVERPQKQYTAKPELLLSFIYFDTTHCGYIFEKDIEELLSTLGLCLSRSQIRRSVGKSVANDKFYYRKLTDKPKEDEVKSEESTVSTVALDLEAVGNGNRLKVPCLQSVISGAKATKVVKTEVASNECTNGEVPVSTSGMVTFRGSLVDIAKMLEQLTRSEKAREDTEQLLQDLKKQHADLTLSNGKANSKVKDLQSDVKSCNRKIGELEQNLSGTNKKNAEYMSILSSINDKVAPLFVKSERSSSRNDSNRERDRERRSRDRDQDKDKERERQKDQDKDKEREKEKDEISKVEIKKESK